MLFVGIFVGIFLKYDPPTEESVIPSRAKLISGYALHLQHQHQGLPPLLQRLNAASPTVALPLHALYAPLAGF